MPEACLVVGSPNSRRWAQTYYHISYSKSVYYALFERQTTRNLCGNMVRYHLKRKI